MAKSKSNLNKDDISIRELYGKECTLPIDNFLNTFSFNKDGLTSEIANDRLNKLGTNEITQNKPKKWYNYFFSSLFTPFNIILLLISLVLFYTDIYLPKEPNYASIVVVIILVLVSTLLDFVQEFRSNKAAEKLKELVATTAHVLRDGKEIKILMKDITLGDVILLSAGSMIPADLRIIESKDLYVSQSSLTR